jgi:DNA-binding NtrC family response regulator
MRLGAVKARRIDCAVISATNQNLEQLVEEKRFRQDLYFRLNNFQIHIPPLRERAEDIFELAQFYINKYNKQYSRRKRISSQGIDMLQSYPFPGNVRELQSVCKQAVLMCTETLLDNYLEQNLQLVCFPRERPIPQQAAGGPSPPKGQAGQAAGIDPARLVADWIASALRSQAPAEEGKIISGAAAAHPLMTQVIRAIIEVAKMIYAETCRQLSVDPAAEQPVQPVQPARPVQPSEPPKTDDGNGPHTAENLTKALDACERELFVKAAQRCGTIRELAEYLQTSPATALRKLKKHGLNL